MANSVADNPSAAAAPTAPQRSLSDRTVGGFLWLLLQTGGGKVLGLGGQIALAWLLLADDFGLVALAFSVTAFVEVIRQGGVREVLIQRRSDLATLANPAGWLSLATGTLSGLIILALAPMAATIYGRPELLGILVVLALASPLTALQVVPTAQLQSQMRFQALALVGLAINLVKVVLMVALAAWGLGAYSFVIPLPIVAALQTIWLWTLARPHMRWDPQWRLWPGLAGAGAFLIGAAFFTAINMHGASVVLGLFHSATEVGIYFFGYNLSGQMLVLLSTNVAYVLLPSFSQLQDDLARQGQAYARVARSLAVLGIPASLVMAAVADPLIRAAFADRWLLAIPVVQLVSLGMALNMPAIASTNLIKSRGRFGFYLGTCIIRAVSFLGLVTVASALGGLKAVAAATALYLALYGPAMIYLGFRLVGQGWRQMAWVYGGPLVAGVVACGTAAALAAVVPDVPGRDWLRVGVTVVVAMLLYLPLIRWAAPDTWRELLSQTSSLKRRR